MKVFIGADYKGFERKNQLAEVLKTMGYEVYDMGAHQYVEGDDFNDAAVAVSLAVRENEDSRGILICDSAHGMTMQANRFKRIRAAHCDSTESAKMAREHDNANVLCLSAHFMSDEEVRDISIMFLETNFIELDRRVRRTKRLDEREDYA